MQTDSRPENDTLEKKAVEKDFGTFKVQANYSPEAIEQKTLKFITPSGDEFEIKGEELAAIMMGTVSSELIEASFVDSEKVNVVEVTRQIRARADRNIKKGEEIRLDYTHPYPVEFALIEEAAKLAIINKDVPMMELTVEYINATKEKITKKQRKFSDIFWSFFQGLKTSRKERRSIEGSGKTLEESLQEMRDNAAASSS